MVKHSCEGKMSTENSQGGQNVNRTVKKGSGLGKYSRESRKSRDAGRK